jgi:hypothetical protein
MAKKKNGSNKSQAIRDVLSADPKANFKTVQSKLAESGIKIGNALFYMVKSKAGKAKRKAKRASAEAASSKMTVRSPVEIVRKVKELAGDVGGMKNLMQLVSLLAD